MKVLSCGPKASNISGISDAISPRYIRKNPRSMYARVPHEMAQFVLKIEKLSHIIGTRNGARLRSPSPIMAPGNTTLKYGDVHRKFHFLNMQELRPFNACLKHFETIFLYLPLDKYEI